MLQVTIDRIRDQAREHQVANANLLNSTKDHLFIAIRNLDQEMKWNASLQSSIQSANHWAAQRLEAKIFELSKQLDTMESDSRNTAKANKILTSLLYPEFEVRHGGITQAHRNTFDWIFQHDTTSFKGWLEGSGYDDSTPNVFWVTGKPGSGKSTLMKFVADHEETKTSLLQWAGGSRLTIASFYFWNPGTEVQKSQCGLLQSLLFQMLRALPDLIPLALPNRWARDGFLLDHSHANLWTVEELTQALARTVAAAAESAHETCFCFFIDGLDEFRPSQNLDHYSLVRDILKLAQWPTVKLCVSSRPWTVFHKQLGSFVGHQQLVLEQLTESDMMAYIYDTLVDDDRFFSRLEKDPSLDGLVSTIQRNASGVFLWVFLVVRSLLDGLTNDDDILQLQERLALIPTDLKQFFLRMLDGVDSAYHADAARLLLLRAEYHMMPYDVYYIPIDRRNPQKLLLAQAEPISDEELEQQQHTGRRYVETWCKDLLTIGVWLDVEFTHRTVADFVTCDAYQLLSQRAGEDEGRPFAPHMACCRLCLCTLKGFDFCGQYHVSHLGRAAKRILRIAQIREAEAEPGLVEVLDELDRVASELYNPWRHHWTNIFYEMIPDSVNSPDDDDDEDTHDSHDDNDIDGLCATYSSFLELAAYNGMTFYVIAKLDTMSPVDREAFIDKLRSRVGTTRGVKRDDEGTSRIIFDGKSRG